MGLNVYGSENQKKILEFLVLPNPDSIVAVLNEMIKIADDGYDLVVEGKYKEASASFGLLEGMAMAFRDKVLKMYAKKI